MSALDYPTMSVMYLWAIGLLPHGVKLVVAFKHQGIFGYNNITPRTTHWEQTEVKEHAALMNRLSAAHANGFEQIGLYGSAIALCKAAGVPSAEMAPVVTMYLGSRMLYNVIYAVHTQWSLSYVRTAVYFGGVGLIGHLFVMGATRFKY